jgi:hypothetical protein
LGASNLTMGFASLLASARHSWGPEIDVLTAFGYGRSYGKPSFFAGRTLPGILQSGLWRDLEAAPRAETRALVTDVGNDILFGVEPPELLEWIDGALRRLRGFTDDIVVTDLPLPSMERLKPLKFLFFRSVFYPPCRLSRETVFERARAVNEGLEALARSHRARFVKLELSWYGFDPIHIRPRRWKDAWPVILHGASKDSNATKYSRAEWIRVHAMPAERQSTFGRERLRPQSGTLLPLGGRIRVY